MAAMHRVLCGILITTAIFLFIQRASALPAAPESFAIEPNPAASVRELGDGARVLFAPGCSARDVSPVALPNGAGGHIRAVSFALESGRIDVVIPNAALGKRAVVVRLGSQATAILQRGHSVLVASPEHIAAAAYAGEMTISAGPTWLTLPAGKRWVREATSSQGRVLSLLEAPTASLSTPLHVAAQGRGRPLPVTVISKVPASRYLVTLSRRDPKRRDMQRFESETPTVELDGLHPGTYLLEARAVDPFGLEGLTAPALELRVVGLELPDGAYFRQGIPQLGERQHLVLSNADGLEMTYGPGDYFVPVPAAIGLNHGRAVLVRLRQPGVPGEASFEIEPRQLESRIVIGPANAVWPKDRVSVHVSVHERGRETSDWSSLGMTLRATLNTKPISLEWACSGASCSSEVPTPGSTGPWVLRVELRDPQGAVLDRAFLEIADAKPQRPLASRS